MAYCGWATSVNKEILDSTTVTVGDGATVQETLEAGGLKKSRLSCSSPPDKYSVTMAFDFVEKKDDGYTELENFYAWYKYVHKFGTVPFQFPAILINSNRQQGYSQEEIAHIAARIENGQEIDADDLPQTEYYCITSAAEGAKSGNCLQITMTWETYATGTVQSEEEEFGIDHIVVTNGEIEVVLNDMSADPSYEPNSATWGVICTPPSGVPYTLTITGCLFDGDRTAVLFFDPVTAAGTYRIRVGTADPDSFTVS